MSARDCIRSSLERLELSGRDPADFQLWVRSVHDDAPYPLIGHEFPYAIQRHTLREVDADDIELPTPHGIYCHFILR